jgi:hypothetical protein
MPRIWKIKESATILHLDSLFWKSYNECNTENSKQFLADDVSFTTIKAALPMENGLIKYKK